MDRGDMKGESFQVRLMRPEELDRVNVLRREIQELHHQGRPDFFRPPSKEHEDAARTLLDEGARMAVAVCGGDILGYALFRFVHREANPYMLERSFAHVEEICVSAGHRCKGVGHALMAFVRQSARENGYERVELDVWSFNESALRFYESEGFQPYRVFLEADA